MSRQATYQDRRTVLGKANLIEPIVRHRIHESLFYKQYLHLTNEATIMTVVGQHVNYVGGTDSTGRPSPFLCCLLRILELEPLSEIINVYLDQLGYKQFKYLTALAMVYIRLVHPSEEVYPMLDTFYTDFRKLRMQLKSPIFSETGIAVHYRIYFVDELVDDLVTKARVFDVILPRLVPRQKLVEQDLVPPRTYHITTNDSITDNKEGVIEDSSNDEESDFVSDSD